MIFRGDDAVVKGNVYMNQFILNYIEDHTSQLYKRLKNYRKLEEW